MPEVAQILRNTIQTTGTLEDRHRQLQTLFTDVSAFSDTAHDFLRQNGDNIIRLGQVSEPQAQMLARYAPEYPCLLGGLVRAGKLEAQAFRGFTLHIVLESLPHQPRGYTTADTPVYADNRGPNCLHLPSPPWNQSNPVRHQPNFNDGVNSPTGKGTDRVAPSYFTRGTGYAGGPAESGLLKSLLGPSLGEPPRDVPDLGVLLVGPMARGARVTLR
jgi:phospholipid/cholesterol/gamma-HCH transport system substrate-binding protein